MMRGQLRSSAVTQGRSQVRGVRDLSHGVAGSQTRSATENQRGELTLTAGKPVGEMDQWITDLARQG